MNQDSQPPTQPSSRSESTRTIPVGEIRGRIQRGLDLCRGQEFEQGYLLLRSITEENLPTRDLPGIFFSYLGYGVAAFEARYNDGVALCERAIEMEFYNPENHFNLARTYLLLGARRKAVSAIYGGLRVDSEYRPLLVLAHELGVRKSPVLSFLSRDNSLNRVLGRLRQSLRPKRR